DRLVTAGGRSGAAQRAIAERIAVAAAAAAGAGRGAAGEHGEAVIGRVLAAVGDAHRHVPDFAGLDVGVAVAAGLAGFAIGGGGQLRSAHVDGQGHGAGRAAGGVGHGQAGRGAAAVRVAHGELGVAGDIG